MKVWVVKWFESVGTPSAPSASSTPSATLAPTTDWLFARTGKEKKRTRWEKGEAGARPGQGRQGDHRFLTLSSFLSVRLAVFVCSPLYRFCFFLLFCLFSSFALTFVICVKRKLVGRRMNVWVLSKRYNSKTLFPLTSQPAPLAVQFLSKPFDCCAFCLWDCFRVNPLFL